MAPDFDIATLVDEHTYISSFATAVQTSGSVFNIPVEESAKLLRRMVVYRDALRAAELSVTVQHVDAILSFLKEAGLHPDSA